MTGCGDNAPVRDNAAPETTEAPESEPAEEETDNVSDFETEPTEEETGDTVDELSEEETEYDGPENIREFKGGMLEETYDSETQKKTYLKSLIP